MEAAAAAAAELTPPAPCGGEVRRLAGPPAAAAGTERESSGAGGGGGDGAVAAVRGCLAACMFSRDRERSGRCCCEMPCLRVCSSFCCSLMSGGSLQNHEPAELRRGLGRASGNSTDLRRSTVEVDPWLGCVPHTYRIRTRPRFQRRASPTQVAPTHTWCSATTEAMRVTIVPDINGETKI